MCGMRCCPNRKCLRPLVAWFILSDTTQDNHATGEFHRLKATSRRIPRYRQGYSPITVNRLGKPVAVFVSMEQFSYFQRVSDAFRIARVVVANTPGQWIRVEDALTEMLKRL